MISKLMDHNEERQMEHPEIWKFEKEFIINFIQKVIHTIKHQIFIVFIFSTVNSVNVSLRTKSEEPQES